MIFGGGRREGLLIYGREREAGGNFGEVYFETENCPDTKECTLFCSAVSVYVCVYCVLCVVYCV